MKAQRDLIKAGVRLELEKAHGETRGALVRVEKQTQAEKSARRWATAAFAAFDLGTGDTRDLVESFTALASASASRAQALHDAQIGAGRVLILSRGYGNCRIVDTRLLNTWRVTYFNSSDIIILDTLEVCRVPDVACAAAEDLEDSAERLAEVLQWVQAS